MGLCITVYKKLEVVENPEFDTSGGLANSET